MTASHAARHFVMLSQHDRWLLVRAILSLVAVDFGLRVFGFQRVMAAIRSRARGSAGSPDLGEAEANQLVRRYVLGVERAARYTRRLALASRHDVVRTYCLQRSLALHYWLLREGLPSKLRIGVRKERGQLKAHAWIELDGQVVNDLPGVVKPFTPLAAPGAERVFNKPAARAIGSGLPWS
jgi:hypothetical protein